MHLYHASAHLFALRNDEDQPILLHADTTRRQHRNLYFSVHPYACITELPDCMNKTYIVLYIIWYVRIQRRVWKSRSQSLYILLWCVIVCCATQYPLAVRKLPAVIKKNKKINKRGQNEKLANETTTRLTTRAGRPVSNDNVVCNGSNKK